MPPTPVGWPTSTVAPPSRVLGFFCEDLLTISIYVYVWAYVFQMHEGAHRGQRTLDPLELGTSFLVWALELILGLTQE